MIYARLGDSGKIRDLHDKPTKKGKKEENFKSSMGMVRCYSCYRIRRACTTSENGIFRKIPSQKHCSGIFWQMFDHRL